MRVEGSASTSFLGGALNSISVRAIGRSSSEISCAVPRWRPGDRGGAVGGAVTGCSPRSRLSPNRAALPAWDSDGARWR